MNDIILPVDRSREAVRERRGEGIPDPDFVVLGDLVDDDAVVQDVLVEVVVRPAPMGARDQSPRFYFHLNQQTQNLPEFPGPYPTLAYFLPLSEFMRGGPLHPTGDNIPLHLDRETRESIMVWWDGYGEEALHRVPVDPTPDDVALYLNQAGLRVRPCGLNADWSVQSWYLGPPPGFLDLGANRTEGGLYLLDSESEDDAGYPLFALVRQHIEVDGVEPQDQIETLDEGLLGEMLRLAPDYL